MKWRPRWYREWKLMREIDRRKMLAAQIVLEETGKYNVFQTYKERKFIEDCLRDIDREIKVKQ